VQQQSLSPAIIQAVNQLPSEADIKITRDLIRAGQLLKIEVLDHIVVGNPNHSSLRGLGYFL
jgi:DNA repair protein RadC